MPINSIKIDEIKYYVEIDLLSCLLSILPIYAMGSINVITLTEIGICPKEYLNNRMIKLGYGFGFFGISAVLSIILKENLVAYSELWVVAQATGGVFFAGLVLIELLIFLPLCTLINIIALAIKKILINTKERLMTAPLFHRGDNSE